jgi:hypothetical protein
VAPPRCQQLHIARANALENNVTVYHVINDDARRRCGRDRPLRRERGTPCASISSANGSRDRRRREGPPWADQTFADAGRVGVWTRPTASLSSTTSATAASSCLGMDEPCASRRR